MVLVRSRMRSGKSQWARLRQEDSRISSCETSSIFRSSGLMGVDMHPFIFHLFQERRLLAVVVTDVLATMWGTRKRMLFNFHKSLKRWEVLFSSFYRWEFQRYREVRKLDLDYLAGKWQSQSLDLIWCDSETCIYLSQGAHRLVLV